MPHSIHVAFLSMNAFAMEMIGHVIEQKVISPRNLHAADKREEYRERCVEQGVAVYRDDTNALIKAEIAVVAVPKREFATAMAPISAITRGKIILAMSEGIDIAYVQERAAKGTYVVSAPPVWNEQDGQWSTTLEYSKGFPEYMRSACEDLVKSMCRIVPSEAS